MAIVPVVLLLTAAAATSVARRHVAVQIGLAMGSLMATVIVGAVLVAEAIADRPVVTEVGGWAPPFGIVVVGDPMGALLTAVAAVVGLAFMGWAATARNDIHPFLLPAALVLIAGTCGAFLTGDLFNLFVFFEVTLIASYVLLVIGGKQAQVRAATIYVPVNLLGSLIFVAAVALVYGIAGTLNMAELAARNDLSSVAAVPGVMFLVAFVLKAALPPLGAWLPASYPRVGAAVGGLFAALLTTIGVVALYRVYAIVYRSDPALTGVLLVLAVGGMLLGGFGALAGTGPREALSFQVIAQVGFMVVALGLGGPAALTAGVFFIAQDLPVKAGIFLATDAKPGRPGANPGRGRGAGAWTFMILGLSLAGMPLLSGFVAKFALLREMLGQHIYAVAGVSLIASLLALLAVTRIALDLAGADEGRHVPLVRIAPAALLAGVSVAVGIWPQWLLAVAREAAAYLDPDLYVEAVLR